MFKQSFSVAFAAFCGITASHGELFVYEPFDYGVVNDPVFGGLTGRNGGLGFSGAWQTETGDSKAFVYDKQGNPEKLYGGLWGAGQPSWDGVVDKLPTLGGYVGVSDWSGYAGGGEQMNSHRSLAKSAGEMAAKNGGVLWLSAVWHLQDASFFSPVGIALTSGGSFQERARTIGKSGNAIGVGNGAEIRQGELHLNPTVRAKGIESVQTFATNISINFSEPMMPCPAPKAVNYGVAKDGVGVVAITSAVFHLTTDTVVLTTARPLDPDASHTVTTRDLADRAGRPLAKPATAKFRTWDNNPEGVKVFVLAGQSNRIGRGRTDKGINDEAGSLGSLRYQVNTDPARYGHWVDDAKNWKELDRVKVWWNRQDLETGKRIIKGNLKIGYGAGPDVIGPEYGIGWALDKHYKEPVLLIKTAWGGKDLYTDFRSPVAVARRGGKVGAYYPSHSPI